MLGGKKIRFTLVKFATCRQLLINRAISLFGYEADNQAFLLSLHIANLTSDFSFGDGAYKKCF